MSAQQALALPSPAASNTVVINTRCENVRLFDEVQVRTQELARSVEGLRAPGEVTQAVNSTLDLETVLSTIVAKAVQLSGTEAGVIYVFDELAQVFHLRATYGLSEELIAAIQDQHAALPMRSARRPGTGSPSRSPMSATSRQAPVREIAIRAGFRARLIVPLVDADKVVGALHDRGNWLMLSSQVMASLPSARA